MLEELIFSIGGMEGWTTVNVKVEKGIIHYVTDNLLCGAKCSVLYALSALP